MQKDIFDSRILDLIPHRPPMLLINRLVSVGDEQSKSEVEISDMTPFVQVDNGVPVWIGMEYMGQTAALIAGYQRQKGTVEPHIGFLMGCRKFKAYTRFFELGKVLEVSCEQITVVGESLANFRCLIKQKSSGELLAEGTLSVFRRKLDLGEN